MTRRCRYNCIILALLLCCISVSALLLLCATSVWWRPQRRGDTWSRVTLALVRHCNLAHRSHHTTLHYTAYTTQPFKHLDPASAASPNQRHIKEPASAAALLTWQFKVQNLSALSTISQVSRSSSANMKCGSYEVYSPLIIARFCTVFFIFLSDCLLQHIFRHIDFRYDRYYQPPAHAENFWNFCRIYQSREVHFQHFYFILSYLF